VGLETGRLAQPVQGAVEGVVYVFVLRMTNRNVQIFGNPLEMSLPAALMQLLCQQ